MLRPWDITKLCRGAVRVLYAPITEPIPTSIADVVGMIDPYDPVGNFADFGAAVDGGSYSRSIESEGQQIQQETGDILSEITDIGRSFSFDIAEIAEDNLVIIENSAGTEAVVGGANEGDQVAVPIGTFDELDRYRIAFVGVRPKDAGAVNEPVGSITRGRLVACVLNRCTVSADETSLEMEKGSLWHGEITFEGFPEPGEDSTESYGRWLFEDAGAIS